MMRDRFVLVAGVALMLGVGVASPVVALESVDALPDTYDGDGLWYFDWNHIQDLHDQGIDGSGVTIAMIDSPVNVDVPTLQGASITPIPPLGCEGGGEPSATSTDVAAAVHGTNVASFIVGSGAGYPGQTGVKGIAPGVHLLAYATLYPEGVLDECLADNPDWFPTQRVALAINDAVARGVDIITVSQLVTNSFELVDALANAFAHDVIVVAGVQNHGAEVVLAHSPGDMNGVLSVSAVRPDGRPVTDYMQHETRDVETDVVAPGWDLLAQGYGDGTWQSQSLEGGTSFATPITAAEIALVMQKYPHATPNQILLSLIHNTGVSDSHEVVFDSEYRLGYGIVATAFLAADPTQYDDVNPFIERMSRSAAARNDPNPDSSWGPTVEQIAAYRDGDGTVSPTPSTDGTDGSARPERHHAATHTSHSDNSSPLPLILISSSVLAAIITGIIIAIRTTSKPTRNNS